MGVGEKSGNWIPLNTLDFVHQQWTGASLLFHYKICPYRIKPNQIFVFFFLCFVIWSMFKQKSLLISLNDEIIFGLFLAMLLKSKWRTRMSGNIVHTIKPIISHKSNEWKIIKSDDDDDDDDEGGSDSGVSLIVNDPIYCPFLFL